MRDFMSQIFLNLALKSPWKESLHPSRAVVSPQLGSGTVWLRAPTVFSKSEAMVTMAALSLTFRPLLVSDV